MIWGARQVEAGFRPKAGEADVDLELFPDQAYQSIMGFGGAFTEGQPTRCLYAFELVAHKRYRETLPQNLARIRNSSWL